MTSNNNPSIDPANNDSLAGSLRFAFNKLIQQINGMLPAKVIKYKRSTNRVQVQLLIDLVTTDGSRVPRPQIASLPVLVLGGGDLMLSFPLKEGDLGWVMANDRDISLFLQSYTESPPNTSRIKNFSDGLFVPDIMHGYTINTEDNDNVVLSTKDGTIRIAISDSYVKVTNGSSTITTTSTEVTIAGTNIKLDGLTEVTGILTGDAGANLTGTIVLTGLGTFPYVITP